MNTNDSENQKEFIESYGGAAITPIHGQPGRFEAIIDVGSQAIKPPSHYVPAQSTSLIRLTIALVNQYRRTNQAEDLIKAIAAARAAVDASPPGHVDHSRSLSNLSASLHLQFNLMNEMKILQEAINIGREAIEAATQDDPEQHKYLSNLATILSIRYQLTGQAGDLDEAINLAQKAVNTIPQDKADRPEYFFNLANIMRERFKRMGQMEDLEEIINSLQEAVDSSPHDDPGRIWYLECLTGPLHTRYQRTRRIGDQDKIIDALRELVNSTPQNHSKWQERLDSLMVFLHGGFSRTGQKAYLDEAISLGHQLITSTPKDDPNSPKYVSHLSDALIHRAKYTKSTDDLTLGILFSYQALDALPKDHPDRPEHLANLSGALRARFKQTGLLSDLEEAVKIGRQAVDNNYQSVSIRAKYLFELSASMRILFERTGRMHVAEEAIEFARQAVIATSQSHPDRSMYLNNLAIALAGRFDRTGQMEDLDEAIDFARQAVASTTFGESNRPVYLHNLGMSLFLRFTRTDQIRDLNEAIYLIRNSIASTPEEYSKRTERIVGLAQALKSRFTRLEEVHDLNDVADLGIQTTRFRDLNESIDLSRQAVASTSNNHPDRPMCLHILGNTLITRFGQTNQRGDLEEAIEVGRQAVELTPIDYPGRAQGMSNLGTYLILRYTLAGLSEDLEDAVALFRAAARTHSAPVHTRLRAAREWGQAAALGQRWDDAIEGYGLAVELSGLVAPPELRRADQEHRLRLLSGLGTEAAATCLKAGEPERAVEMFEHGRAVLFSQTLDTRSPLTELRETHPGLAERFAHWRDELNRPESTGIGLSLDTEAAGAASRATADYRREAALELDRVLNEIRTQPGFERFLKPRTAAELLVAAAHGPVVLLNITTSRSDALVLTPKGIEVVLLEGVRLDEVSRKLNAFLTALAVVDDKSKPVRGSLEETLAGVLAWLGERITGPVLDHLGYTGTPGENQAWPRIWWCPSGPLSLLPLHAAGHHQKVPGRLLDAVIDRVISSTIPTIRALLMARQSSPSTEQRVLAVAMPHTPSQPDLLTVAQEVGTLRQLYEDRVTVLGLPGTDPATHDTVLAALPGHSLVHFSCHGESDLDNPSASHLLLADYQTKPLTVLDLAATHIRGADLVFLSACTTARTGTTLPDEPIHLAAACQLAGYRHIIASLWPVGEADTAALTDDFYTTYAHTSGAPDPAAALHHATRELRYLYRNQPSHWAPYTHTGP